jgi:hypothetical protein
MIRSVLCVMVMTFLSACSVQSRSWIADEIIEEIIFGDDERLPSEQQACQLDISCDDPA